MASHGNQAGQERTPHGNGSKAGPQTLHRQGGFNWERQLEYGRWYLSKKS